MLFYVSFQFVIFVPALLIFLTGDAQYFFRVSYVFSILGSAFMVLSFFIHPGISDKQRTAVVFRSKNKSAYDGNRLDPAGEGYTHTLKPLQNLTRKQIAQMKNEIDTLLRRSLPFLRHGYSLQEMATSLSFPQYQLSALINQEYGMNFNELVNKYRIDYAIHSIRDGKASHLNINGLADQCGFNNRNSFTTAFKKFTGLTPSEYFKTLEH
jgi:AraC-like DNA-binding protein